jgi:hypothetical protein
MQRLFADDDPSWEAGPVVSVGSLGVPGAYSSGMNASGLALADTQVRTTDHGEGVSRYVLMNILLRRCATVAEALDLIAALPHVGGGTLVLADASGAAAAVELRHSGARVEHGRACARTNHFTFGRERWPAPAHSAARRGMALDAMAGGLDPERILALRGDPPLSWHAADGDALTTISGVVYRTDTRGVRFCEGPPDLGPWIDIVRDTKVPGGWRVA